MLMFGFRLQRRAPRAFTPGARTRRCGAFGPVRRFRDYVRICALGLLLRGAAHASPGAVELETFAARDGNPSRSQAGSGVPAENIYGIGASMLRTYLIDEHSGVLVRGSGALLTHTAFAGLNELVLNANLRYRWQPAVGYTLPWYEVLIDVERHKHANSTLRDAIGAALELSVGKYFTDRVYATSGIGVRRTVADRGNVFDQTEAKAFATAAYRFGQEETFYARLSRTRGDRVFGADESYGMSGHVKAGDDDPVFGAGRYAYRMTATANVIEIGVDLPVRGHGAWDIGAKRARAYADGGPAYGDNLILVSWRYRYY